MRTTKDYGIILFDLDGTLTDSKPGIVNSFNYALKSMGFEEQDAAALERFVGPPLKYSFKTICGFDDKQIDQAIRLYREYYSVKGMFENSVYPGIPELLQRLKSSGKTLAVATSKIMTHARKILEYFKLADYFAVIAGSNPDDSRSTKEEVLRYCLDELHISQKEGVVLVGDTKYDVIGAREVGIDCICVLYGYGSLEELRKENPTYIVETVEDVGRMLLG